MFAQVAVLLLQNYFGPAFFLPRSVSKLLHSCSNLADLDRLQLGSVEVYDYHPPLPLPDPEAPEQSLGDCSICMDAIEVDSALRQSADEKNEGHGFGRHTTSLWAQSARKNYSLAPCHHLFVRQFLKLMRGDIDSEIAPVIVAHCLPRKSEFFISQLVAHH